MKEVYLITGILGHLGSTVARCLLASGKIVRGFDRYNVRDNGLKDMKLPMFYGDIRKKEDLEPFFSFKEKCNIIVIHCAGIVSISSHYDDTVYTVNVNGTKNIVDLCLLHNVKKLIHISSVHAIPEGIRGSIIKEVHHFDADLVKGLYAKTKAEASQYVLNGAKKGLDASIIHPSGIIGPNDLGNGNLTNLIIDYFNRNLTAIVHGGYDFVDVRDVSDAIISAITKGKKGECYIISNRFFSIKEIMNITANIANRKPIKTILPMWFAKITAPLSEIYYRIRKKPPLFTSYSLYTLQSNATFSHDFSTKKLLYQTREMEVTIRDTITYLKEHDLIR